MMPASSASLPEALKPIAWLKGRWKTQENATGKYPTIQDFDYQEVLEFTCVGQPMFNFTSTSWHPVKGNPMHQERGFIRIKPGSNQLAFVVSHNFGLTTVEEGVVDEDSKEIKLKSVSVTRMSFAKAPQVVSLERTIRLQSEDTLVVVTSMETDSTKLTEHLQAVYKKEG